MELRILFVKHLLRNEHMPHWNTKPIQPLIYVKEKIYTPEENLFWLNFAYMCTVQNKILARSI